MGGNFLQDKPFKENYVKKLIGYVSGKGDGYVNDWIRLIEKEGPMTLGNLCVKFKVTMPAVILWMRHREVLRC
jgi:hypothetical protein